MVWYSHLFQNFPQFIVIHTVRELSCFFHDPADVGNLIPGPTAFSKASLHIWYQTTCLLINLYAGQKATVKIEHGITDWFQIGKGVRQGCILSPCLFNLCAKYVMRNAGLDEAQAGIKIAGRNISNADIQITPPLWQKAKKN